MSYQAQVYQLFKELDPYHPTIGAVNCGNSWMFTDQAPSWLASEQDDGDRKIPTATQPTLQLSLDVVMQENYAGDVEAHAGDGSWAGGVGSDGFYRHGATFEPIYNCPGDFAWKGSPEASLAAMWLGVIAAGMFSDLNFLYTEANWKGPVEPTPNADGNLAAWQLAVQQAVFAEQVHYLAPAILAPFGSTEHPLVSVAAAPISARAWSVPPDASLNCSKVLAVVNSDEDEAKDFFIDFEGWAGGSATRLFAGTRPPCVDSTPSTGSVGLGDVAAAGGSALYCLKTGASCPPTGA